MFQLSPPTMLPPLNMMDGGDARLAGGGMRHRASTCYWNGTLFSLLPKAAQSDYDVGDQHGLDLQINAVAGATINGAGDAPFTLATPLVSYPLVDIGSVPANTRVLTALAGDELGAAFAFWIYAAVPSAPGAGSLSYFSPSLNADGTLQQPWDKSKIQTITIEGLAQVGIQDLACTTVGDTVYFVCVGSSSGDIGVFTYRQGIFSAVVTALNLGVDRVTSLDVAAVSVPMPGGGQGLCQRLAVVALTNSTSGIACSLIDPAEVDALLASSRQSLSTTNLPVPSPPYQSLLNAGPGPMVPSPPPIYLRPGVCSTDGTIRACWGTAPVQGGSMISNGLVLGYLGIVPQKSSAIVASAFLTVVDLTSPAATPPDWMDVGVGESSGLSYCTSLSSMCPVSVQNKFNDGSGASASYTVVFTACVRMTDIFLGKMATWVAQIIPSYKLTPSGGPSSYNANPGADDQSLDAAVSAWLLLGVVTGLPPFPSNAKKSSVSLSLSQSSSTGASASVTSKKSATFGAKAGGEVFSIGGSVTTAVSQGSDTGATWQVSVTYSWDNGENFDPDTGWLIVAQPNYQIQQYAMASWDGKATGVTMSVLWSTGASLAYYPFKLSAPNTPHPHSDPQILQRLCTFPENDAGAVSWPLTTDLDGWRQSALNPTTWGLTSYASSAPLQVIEATSGGSFKSSIVSTSDLKQTTGSTVSIEVKAGASLGPVSLEAKGEYSVNHSVTNSFSHGTSLAIGYGQLAQIEPGQPGYDSVMVQPFLYQCTIDDAPWVPSIFSKQRPWLLTWQVTRTIA